ncbi:MAG: NAD(P)-dependent alcohol dehydrogenase [Gammaproteobacteria bacterium]|nr:NAD(P)-dependent alcohol dehydrogenase [Gammaproteobacteria bacterium]
MKAIVYEKYGSPDVLELKEVEIPALRDNEVLIKVHAASINSWDWDMLTGRPLEYRLFFGLLKSKNKILGCDIAGRIEAVGSNIKHLQPGDDVFGDLSEGSWGGFAEYVCARENELTLKPAGMTFEEAAATPQAGILALQGLCEKREIKPGQRILINGAGGGVGTFAIQMAKTFGAEVTGVDSAGKLDMISSLGADHVIDYTQQDFTRNGKSYDLILDVKTDRSIFNYRRSLSANGIYVTVGGRTAQILQLVSLGSLISRVGSKKLTLVMHKPNKDMKVLNELFDSGKVKPVVDRCFPLSETAEAFRYFGEGHFKGKVVITMAHNEKPYKSLHKDCHH